MAIRMIEYDFLVALKHARKDGFEYTINYPESCVIYLRHKKSTPDFLTVHVNIPNGNRIDYRTPVIAGNALVILFYLAHLSILRESFFYLSIILSKFYAAFNQRTVKFKHGTATNKPNPDKPEPQFCHFA